ncbi:hypothetical protein ACHWQZ_G008524 [Mnemiopsis leidyi]
MSEKLGPATIAVIVLSAYIALIILILLVKHLTRNACCEGGCAAACCVGANPLDSFLVCLAESCDCRCPTTQQLADTVCPTQAQCNECCLSCLPDTACQGDITCCCFEIRLAGPA